VTKVVALGQRGGGRLGKKGGARFGQEKRENLKIEKGANTAATQE